MLLLDALRRPESVAALDARGWNELLPVLRHARLLAQFGVRIESVGLASAIPAAAAAQIAEARIAADASVATMRFEAGEVGRILRRAGIPFVLLKGAAYAATGLPAAAGRPSSDLDLLVGARVDEAEGALRACGWKTENRYGSADGYGPEEDQHVRDWMHQVPALRHEQRGTAVDLHHSISPPRGRVRADAAAIIAAARPCAWDGALAPSPVDMIIVCAAHLAREVNLSGALRDVVDFDSLCRHFASPSFGAQLMRRAAALNALDALSFAARASRRFLETPSPPELQYTQTGLLGFLANLIVDRALVPDGVEPPSVTARMARWILYVRALQVQMPLRKVAMRSVSSRLRSLHGRFRLSAADRLS